MPVNSFDHYPMTWRPSLEQGKGPIYKTLAMLLEEDIKSGTLKPGTKLPPQRELADFLDINLSTVSRAFKLCEQSGYICASIGNGTYVSTDAGSNSILFSNPEHVKLIEMGAILPNQEPNKYLIEAMQKLLCEPESEKLFGYGIAGGTPWQKEAAAAWIQKANYSVRPSDILFANGGQNAITAVLAALFKPGDKIGTDPLVYPGIKTAAKMLGIQLVPIEVLEHEMTEEGLVYACKNEKIKGLYIIPDFHNPTTHSMCLDKRVMIAEVAKRNNLIIIEDAINALLHENPLPPVAFFAKEQTIYISSLSKTLSPGIRLAYVSVSDKIRKEISTALYNMNITVSPLVLELSSRLIHGGIAEYILSERRAYTKRQNEIVNHYLANYKIYGDEFCPFRWVVLPDTFTGKSFEMCAKNEGVQVYSSDRFTVGNSKPGRGVRISVTAARNKLEFEEGIKILKRILEKEEEMDMLL